MNPRLGAAVMTAARSLARGSWRLARQLFHEMTGALFAVFAVLGGAAAWREYQRGAAEWVVALVAAFAALMVWFAVTSFFTARRIR